MPYVPINIMLDKRLTPNSSISIAYPLGKTEGSFFAASNHTLAVGSRFFRSPHDFIVVPEKDKITIHWRANLNVEKGEILNVQLDELGSEFFFDQKTGVTVRNMMKCPLFMINIGTPKIGDPIYYVPPMNIKSAGSLPISSHNPDVARVVTISSTGDDTHRVFRVEGEDMYFRTMVEEIAGPNCGIVASKKAFAKISRIIVSGDCNGSISIGYGNGLGFPIFMPSAAFVLKEVFNGDEIEGGKIIAGDIGVPGPDSADRRGLYTPPETITLDGRKPLYILAMVPNPSNIGAPDWAG